MSSVITLPPGCFVFEPWEGEEGEEVGCSRWGRRAVMLSSFSETRVGESKASGTSVASELRNKLLFALPIFEKVCDFSPLAHSNTEGVFD